MSLLLSLFIAACILLAVLYAFIIAFYRRGWRSLPSFPQQEADPVPVKISVLIPARNEEVNILECLNSVFDQSLAAEQFEVILINDHSEDKTVELAESLGNPRLKILHLKDYIKPGETQSFKKKAIEVALKQASGDLIVTTDADCVVGRDWLKLFASFYTQKNVKFIAAPVTFFREKSLLERFQTLDFLGMMCVTGAGIHTRFMNMCNGANLAYEKEAFYAVGGFSGIEHLASGDDMLLMHKIAAAYPDQIGFLKNTSAIVRTEAKPDLASFTSQRIRWATKSAGYEEWQVTAVLAAVFFHCWCIVISFFLIPFFGPTMFAVFLFQLLIKTTADRVYLGMMAEWFDRKDVMRDFLPAEFMHILYIVWVGTVSNFFKTYEWKGRRVR